MTAQLTILCCPVYRSVGHHYYSLQGGLTSYESVFMKVQNHCASIESSQLKGLGSFYDLKNLMSGIANSYFMQMRTFTCLLLPCMHAYHLGPTLVCVCVCVCACTGIMGMGFIHACMQAYMHTLTREYSYTNSPTSRHTG